MPSSSLFARPLVTPLTRPDFRWSFARLGAIPQAVLIAVVLSFNALSVPVAHSSTGSYEEIVNTSERKSGFLNLLWRESEGKLYAEVDALDTPFIYYTSLSEGVGSNDLGLDRGRLGDTQLVKFQKTGNRILLIALNTKYVANTDNPAEQRAVREAFASSVLWGFEIVAEHDDRFLIDLTDMALSDATNVTALLERRNEGKYKVDTSRSVVNLPRTKAFPDNTEVDALVTLTGSPSGKILRTVSPDATAITMHFHHSFVRLPDDGYTPLPYDPRAGFIDGSDSDLIYDYASPISESVTRGFARRHRLQKVDPEAAMSRAVEPIVYYVDNGVPEPIRGALIEGASWWNQAFEAAGFNDGFQVKVLPEDADPMDVRYNVIQWVHRSTRGWSYGMSVRDPRTQEIIKGHVSLGSLRVRQDYLIAEGLLAPYKDGFEDEAEKILTEFSLARIRQLSAHEVGHTLGLEHNFAASADDRASVMDYPYPYVELKNNQIDISDAYRVGMGAWDKRAITWGYSDFPSGVDDAAARAQIIKDTLAMGLSFVADQHSRNDRFAKGAGPCHTRGALWDNGADPVAELNRLMELRTFVLNNFSDAVIQRGQPMAKIEEVLVPAYLMHRYQVQAAATVLGGRDFTYALRGDGQVPTATVDANKQKAALDALLQTLDPKALVLRPALVKLISPRPPMSVDSRELFPRESGYLFDPVAAASTAAQLTLAMIFDSSRATRLNNQRALDASLPSFDEVIEATLSATWMSSPDADPALGLVQRRVQTDVLSALASLVTDKRAGAEVRSQAHARAGMLAQTLEGRLKSKRAWPEGWRPHFEYAVSRIKALQKSAEAVELEAATVPPGSPI